MRWTECVAVDKLEAFLQQIKAIDELVMPRPLADLASLALLYPPLREPEQVYML